MKMLRKEEQWQKGNSHTKKLVLKLVFEQNLAHNKNSGFETAILSLPLRVFSLPNAQKGLLVEVEGVEPSCIADTRAGLREVDRFLVLKRHG
jgi:hypothetical protein